MHWETETFVLILTPTRLHLIFLECTNKLSGLPAYQYVLLSIAWSERGTKVSCFDLFFGCFYLLEGGMVGFLLCIYVVVHLHWYPPHLVRRSTLVPGEQRMLGRLMISACLVRLVRIEGLVRNCNIWSCGKKYNGKEKLPEALWVVGGVRDARLLYLLLVVLHEPMLPWDAGCGL